MSRKRKQLHKRSKPVERDPSAPAARVQDLMSQGWSRRDADHLCVIELALEVAPTLSPPGRRVLAQHVATALSWAPVRLATPTLFGSEEHAEAWRALSAAADPPFDRFMAEMAAVEHDIVPASDLTLELLHPDNVRHVLDCSRAEARGDFAGAIGSLKQAIRPLPDTWLAELELMHRRGAELTPAQWGRWMCGAALRWGENTEYGLETGLRLAELVLLTLRAPAERLADWTPTRLAWDTVIHDALLFDHGLLDHWLSHQAAPRLLENAPGVGSWVLAQPTIVELAGAEGPDSLVRDLRSGRDVVVGDRGLADDHPTGRLFYGRLVQVEDDERSWFATLPTIIDSPDVVEAVLQVIEAGGDDEARLRAFYMPLRQVVDPDDPRRTMGSMPVKPRDVGWTVEDLVDLPDDGLQYELAGGTLLVTPSPRPLHQRMSMRLAVLLAEACPEGLEVFAAPLDFQPSRVTSLQPDLLVVRRDEVGEERITGTPLLVVEILSPSTRAKDLVLKRALYAESGVPSYWVLDPTEPSVLALDLVDGTYITTGTANGQQELTLTQPFHAVLSPDELVR